GPANAPSGKNYQELLRQPRPNRAAAGPGDPDGAVFERREEAAAAVAAAVRPPGQARPETGPNRSPRRARQPGRGRQSDRGLGAIVKSLCVFRASAVLLLDTAEARKTQRNRASPYPGGQPIDRPP